jgi:hypothetical protein
LQQVGGYREPSAKSKAYRRGVASLAQDDGPPMGCHGGQPLQQMVGYGVDP